MRAGTVGRKDLSKPPLSRQGHKHEFTGVFKMVNADVHRIITPGRPADRGSGLCPASRLGLEAPAWG